MKIRIKIEQELELPENATLVDHPSGQLIKTEGKYLSPQIEYGESIEFNSKEMKFSDMSEESAELIYSALSKEKCKIESV